MSFIRCLSNPEGLYIFGSVSGFVEIYHNKTIPGTCINVKPRHWDGIFRAVKKYDCGAYGVQDKVFKYGDVTVSEVHSHEDGSICTHTMQEQFKKPCDCHFKVRLQVKDQFVDMWFVTWHYLYSGMEERWRWEKRDKARRRKKLLDAESKKR